MTNYVSVKRREDANSKLREEGEFRTAGRIGYATPIHPAVRRFLFFRSSSASRFTRFGTSALWHFRFSLLPPFGTFAVSHRRQPSARIPPGASEPTSPDSPPPLSTAKSPARPPSRRGTTRRRRAPRPFAPTRLRAAERP